MSSLRERSFSVLDSLLLSSVICLERVDFSNSNANRRALFLSLLDLRLREAKRISEDALIRAAFSSSESLFFHLANSSSEMK